MSTPSFCEMLAKAEAASPPDFISELERVSRLRNASEEAFEYLPAIDATNPQDASEGMATYRSASKEPR